MHKLHVKNDPEVQRKMRQVDNVSSFDASFDSSRSSARLTAIRNDRTTLCTGSHNPSAPHASKFSIHETTLIHYIQYSYKRSIDNTFIDHSITWCCVSLSRLHDCMWNGCRILWFDVGKVSSNSATLTYEISTTRGPELFEDWTLRPVEFPIISAMRDSDEPIENSYALQFERF